MERNPTGRDLARPLTTAEALAVVIVSTRHLRPAERRAVLLSAPPDPRGLRRGSPQLRRVVYECARMHGGRPGDLVGCIGN